MTTPQPTTERPSQRETPFGFREVMRHWWNLDERKAGTLWMYWLVTFIYNSVIAVVLTILFVTFDPRAKWAHSFRETFVISNCIGFSIYALMELFFGILKPKLQFQLRAWQRSVIAVSLAFIGIYLGYTIAFAIFGRNFTAIIAAYPSYAFGMLIIGLLACIFWMLVMDGQTRRVRAEADEAKYAEERARLSALAKGAELRALQAQIEPHFLFNTLANVLALIDFEPQKAKMMLESFITHLRSSLDASRQAQATLGSELDLLQSYLALIEIRMANRLKFEIDCPAELRNTPFAPLLLQPLVENAVKYGLEPKIEGGTIQIRAIAKDNAIRIEVEDDGVGFGTKSTARPGSGTGLTNVRERLSSIYGDRATLSVTALAAPHTGTLSTILIADSIPKSIGD